VITEIQNSTQMTNGMENEELKEFLSLSLYYGTRLPQSPLEHSLLKNIMSRESYDISKAYSNNQFHGSRCNICTKIIADIQGDEVHTEAVEGNQIGMFRKTCWNVWAPYGMFKEGVMVNDMETGHVVEIDSISPCDDNENPWLIILHRCSLVDMCMDVLISEIHMAYRESSCP